jgi:hypothetical protein
MTKKIKQTLKIFLIILNISIVILGIYSVRYFIDIKFYGYVVTSTILTLFWIVFNIILSINPIGYFLSNPILGKAIYHRCGTFFVDIWEDRYFLYDDKIFYKKELDYIYFYKVGNEKDLYLYIKNFLDAKYKEELKIQEKKDILNNFDGYVDEFLKREKTLNKLL